MIFELTNTGIMYDDSIPLTEQPEEVQGVISSVMGKSPNPELCESESCGLLNYPDANGVYNDLLRPVKKVWKGSLAIVTQHFVYPPNSAKASDCLAVKDTFITLEPLKIEF